MKRMNNTVRQFYFFW